jgi:ABC-2 type transport system permease protein
VSLRRAAAVARRIVQGFRRDHRSLALIVVVPVVMTALLGWVIRDQGTASVRIAAVGLDGAPAALTDALKAAATTVSDETGLDVSFVSATGTLTVDAAKDLIRNGDADAALVSPSDLLAQVLAGGRPTFTIVTEGTDPGTDGTAFAAVSRVLAAAAAGFAPPGSTAIAPVIDHQTVYLSAGADELDVLAPVFLGYFAYFFVFILTGISFLRERTSGTLERLLATPVTRGEIVLGYSVGFAIFAILQVLILTAYTLMAIDVPAIGPIPAFTFGLNVHAAGSPALAFLIAVFLAIGAVVLGIFLSTYARTELQVVQFIPIVIVPQGLLGGIFWPVDRLPDILQPIARVLPVTYAVDGLREVMLRGADLGSSAVQLDLAVLLGIAVLFVVLAARTISREVA